MWIVLIRIKGDHGVGIRREVWGEVKDLRRLEEPFTEEEIKEVIWWLAPKKAPRSNGFLIFFFRHI